MKLRNIFSRRNRILLRELVITDFKLKYQGSALGYLWSILKPLMLFAIMYVVFVKFLRWGGDIPHYAVYLLTGMVIWNFFTEATSLGLRSIVDRRDLLRKINFPRYILTISATVSALITLLINLGVVFLFAVVNGVEFTWYIFLLPVVLIELYAFSLGVAFLLGTIYVKYRDVAHIWDVVVQGMFYATPIIYPLSMVVAVNPAIAQFLLANPMAQMIQDARYLVVTQETLTIWNIGVPPVAQFIPIAIVFLFAAWAALYFHKRSKNFAEDI